MLPSMVIVASSQRPVGAGPDTPRPGWREAMKRAIRDARTLCQMLELPDSWANAAVEAARSFPVFAPLEFIARMRAGDPGDPLLRQILPVRQELETVEGFSPDPVADGSATLRPGLLQKYPGRTLIVTTGACAVHCRYCFRRHFPYSDAPAATGDWDGIVARIAADPGLEEVLLSGGDPLTLPDERLSELAERLAAIPHVRRLRIHTRVPIVIPQRVTPDLIGWLRGTRLTPLVVVHINHPQEIDEPVRDALAKLVDAGIPVLNQAVLLRGINDDVATLEQLCRQLVDLRVLPYYLHQLDRVAGAHHFDTPAGQGERLVAELRERLPGYAVPRFVREVAGESSKRVLA